MGKGTTTSEFVARKGCKRELQFVLKSQCEIGGGESLGRTRASTRNLNVESTGMEAKRRITTIMSDLPEDLVAQILFRVPITSLGSMRSTCKQWNSLSRNQIFGKLAEAKNQFLGFMMKDFRICSVRMDLQRMRDNFIDLSIKHVSVLNQIKVSKVYHCDGLLLCILTDNPRLLVWNPYLGQTKWIHIPHLFDSFDGFSLGCDNNGNRKILHILNFRNYRRTCLVFKIYEFSSNSWKDLDVTPNCHISPWHYFGVILKGNAYFYAFKDIIVEGKYVIVDQFLLCFDFTSERFGPRLSLPFRSDTNDTVILSLVRDKQLAVLSGRWSSSPKIMEIWVTNKIDYDEVLWTKWMEMDINPDLNYILFGSFFIDEENKVAVVFDLDTRTECYDGNFYQRVHVIKQDGYFKSMFVGGGSPYQVKDNLIRLKPLCSSYVPSLVEIE